MQLKSVATRDDEAAFCRFQSGTDHLSQSRKIFVSCILCGFMTEKIVTTLSRSICMW